MIWTSVRHAFVAASLCASSVRGLASRSASDQFRDIRGQLEHARQIINPKLVSKRIQRSKHDLQCCLALLDDYRQEVEKERGIDLVEQPFLEALRVCSRHQALDEALRISRDFPSEGTLRQTISICGKCGNLPMALELLRHTKTTSIQPTASIYNAILAACANCHDWKTALDLLEHDMPLNLVSSLSCNIVLTLLAKEKLGSEAQRLLDRMRYGTDFPDPRIESYHKCMLAHIREGNPDAAYELLQQMESNVDDLDPNDCSYDMVICAYSKAADWEMVNELQAKGHRGFEELKLWSNDDRQSSLRKVGSGKAAYWEFGTYDDSSRETKGQIFKLALKPNRNPAKNGMKVMLFDESGLEKVGYVLIINSKDDSTSTMIGAFVSTSWRKAGIAKILLGSWIKLCLDGGIEPLTGLIHKPLLCLVLQRSFGFVPGRGGVDVNIARGKEASEIVMSSNNVKSLHGVFSPSDIRRECIKLQHSRGETLCGQEVRVGCNFKAPSDLCQRLELVLSGSMQHSLSREVIQCMLLGSCGLRKVSP